MGVREILFSSVAGYRPSAFLRSGLPPSTGAVWAKNLTSNSARENQNPHNGNTPNHVVPAPAVLATRQGESGINLPVALDPFNSFLDSVFPRHPRFYSNQSFPIRNEQIWENESKMTFAGVKSSAGELEVMPMANMPAALAASSPTTESSITAQREVDIPSLVEDFK